MSENEPVRGLADGERAALVISECQNRHTDPAFGRGAASVEAELNPLICTEPSDWLFKRRQGLTDFAGSEIDQVLRNLRVETVILTGVSTNIGVLGNMLDVFSLPFLDRPTRFGGAPWPADPDW